MFGRRDVPDRGFITFVSVLVTAVIAAGCGMTQPAADTADGSDREVRAGASHANLISLCMAGWTDACEAAVEAVADAARLREIDIPTERALLTDACRAGVLNGCGHLEWLLRSSGRPDKFAGDERIAPVTDGERALLLNLCLNGSPLICKHWFGTWGRDEWPDVTPETMKAFSRMCDDEGAGESCVEAAFLVEAAAREGGRGAGEQPHMDDAIELYRKACGNGVDFACLWSGGVEGLPSALPEGLAAERGYFDKWRNLEQGVPYQESSLEESDEWDAAEDGEVLETVFWVASRFPDEGLADNIAFLKTRCDRGAPAACLEYGLRLATSTHGEYDAAQIIAAWKRACSGNSRAACDLMDAVRGNAGFVPEWARVHRLLDASCRAGNGEACYGAWITWGDYGPPGIGRRRTWGDLVQSCNLGYLPGCIALTVDGRYEYESDVALRVPFENVAWVATNVLEPACRQGLADACHYLWVALKYDLDAGAVHDAGAARHYLDKACRLGEDEACQELLRSVPAVGAGPAEDRRDLKKLLASCDRGDGPACMSASLMVEAGKGGSKDLKRAGELARRANLLEDLAACDAMPHVDESISGIGLTEDVRICFVGDDLRRCWGACLAGEQDACFSVASIFQESCPYLKSKAFFEEYAGRACAAGNGQACEGMADMMYMQDIGDELQPGPVADLYARACRLGRYGACEMIARPGLDPASPDEIRARNLAMRKACLAGKWQGCYPGGMSLLDGKGAGAVHEARTLFGIGCNAGSEDCCEQLAYMLKDGRGGPADPISAYGLLDVLCENGWGDPCRGLAEISLAGATPDVPNWETTLNYLWDGCNKYSGEACMLYADDLDRHPGSAPSDDATREAALGQACEAGVAEGCLEAGYLVRFETDENPAAWFKKACDLDDPAGCGEYAEYLLYGSGDANSHARGIELLKRACEMGAVESCNILGVREVADGSGDGTGWFRRGCGKGDVEMSPGACYNLAMVRPQDPDAKRVGLFERACGAGLDEACMMATALLWKSSPIAAHVYFLGTGLNAGAICRRDGTISACAAAADLADAVGDAAMAAGARQAVEDIRNLNPVGRDSRSRTERLSVASYYDLP